MKGPVGVSPPSGYFLLVFLCVGGFGESVLLPLLDDLTLDLNYGPAIECGK